MQHGVERGAISRRLVVIVMGVLLLLAGIVLFMQYREGVAQRPETTGNRFVAALTEADATTTHGMLTKEYKEVFPKDIWESWVKSLFTNYTGPNPKATKVETVNDPEGVYGKNATPSRVTYEFEFTGKKYSNYLILISSGDTWKVAEIGEFK